MAADFAVRGLGLAASAFCGFKVYELLVDFPTPCQLMVEQARGHPAVAERVGTPMQRSFFWTGRVTEKRAAVQIPIWGPLGRATLVGGAVCTPLAGSADAPDASEQPPARLWDVLTLEIESPGQVPPPVSLMPEVPQASEEEMEKHRSFHRALARPRS